MEDMVFIPQVQLEALLIAWDEFLEGVASCAGLMPDTEPLDALEAEEDEHATVQA